MISVSQPSKKISGVSKEGFDIIAKALDLPKDENYYNGLIRKFRSALTGINLDIRKLSGSLRVKNGTESIESVTLVRVSYPLEYAPHVISSISGFESESASKSGKSTENSKATKKNPKKK